MIKIVCGVYGHYIDGRVVAKNSDSEPFSLTPRQEAELVAKGVAAFVDEVTEVSHAGASAPIGFDESPEPDIEIPEYSVDSKADELREIGKAYGLHFKVGMTKADMVSALDAFFAEKIDEDDADADEAEDDDLGLPDFDPTEAVE
jgi:hypothetical protein